MNQKSTFFIPILDLFLKFVYIGTKLDQIMVVMAENKKKLNAADLASLLRSEINLGQYVRNDKLPTCLLYTSPSPRDATLSRMPSSA